MMMRRILMATIYSAMIQLAISTTTECPDQTQELVKGVCVRIRRLNHKYDLKKFTGSFDAAFEECDELQIGQLKWYSPKVDTREKRKKLEQVLEKFMGKSTGPRGNNALSTEQQKPEWKYPSIWLGLRRTRPFTSPEKETTTDESMWYWTKDNSTLNIRNLYGEDFWDVAQPDTEVGDNQTCAICLYVHERMYGPGKRLRFADVKCNDSSSTPINTDDDENTAYRFNLIGLVCMADLKKPTPSPPTPHTLDQWWFYLICGLFVVIPIVVLLVVCVVVMKDEVATQDRGGKKKKREKKEKRKYRRPKPLRENGVRREPSDELTVSSHTLESYMAVQPPCPPCPSGGPRVGYYCPPGCEPGANKMGNRSMSSDEDDHEYSNVIPRSSKLPNPCGKK